MGDDTRSWKPRDLIEASRLEAMRKQAYGLAGNIKGETGGPIAVTYIKGTGAILRFDQNYGRLRFGRVDVNSDISPSDNFVILRPCDSDGSYISSDYVIKTFMTGPIDGKVYYSDYSISAGQVLPYLPFGSDKGFLTTPIEQGMTSDLYRLSDIRVSDVKLQYLRCKDVYLNGRLMASSCGDWYTWHTGSDCTDG